jgi:hypothetical protein
MENSEITQTKDFLIDYKLTNLIQIKRKNTPFDFALKHDIEEIKKSSLENSTSQVKSNFKFDKISLRQLFIQSEYVPIQKVSYTKTIQEWKGKIIEIFDSKFVAELEDLTLGGTKEIAEIDFENVDFDDKKLIELGSIFYWSIFQYTKETGQVEKISKIRFQRIANWSTDDIDEIEDRANYLFKNLEFS